MDREITITVTDEQARQIDELVASGAFESPEAVVRAAMDAFEGWDLPDWLPPVETLRKLVDEAAADPRLLDPDDVRQFLLEHHEKRVQQSRVKVAR